MINKRPQLYSGKLDSTAWSLVYTEFWWLSQHFYWCHRLGGIICLPSPLYILEGIAVFIHRRHAPAATSPIEYVQELHVQVQDEVQTKSPWSRCYAHFADILLIYCVVHISMFSIKFLIIAKKKVYLWPIGTNDNTLESLTSTVCSEAHVRNSRYSKSDLIKNKFLFIVPVKSH